MREYLTVLKSRYLTEEFLTRFANEAARVGKNAQLSDAALVVDALGEDAKWAIVPIADAWSLLIAQL